LLRGIAGTGKTLILLYRAKLDAANDENIRILILCWNTALANYMRQAYNQFQFEAKGKVEIVHFTDFAHNLLGFRGEPEEGWDNPAFVSRFNKKKIGVEDRYDAIYIDEAQDFRQEWIEYIFNNLIKGEPKERNLIIAADDAQRVYKQRNFSWANLLGIPMSGRSKILRTIYRNSARVWVFSAYLLEDKASYSAEAQGKLRFAEKGGYDPQLIECKNMSAQIDKAIEIIRKLIKKGKAARNVLILYRHKVVPGSQYPLVEELIRKLADAKIPNNWFAEDGGTKRSFNWNEDSVKISTVHSGKGMDSPVVIVLGAETFSPSFANDEYDETRLMYVALTRAREFLVVLHSGDRGLVPQLLHCQEEYLKHYDAITQLENAQ
jgi:superfamily I DNA and RNA helicase